VIAAPHFNLVSPSRSLAPAEATAVASVPVIASPSLSSAARDAPTKNVQTRPQAVETLRVATTEPDSVGERPVAVAKVSWTSSGVTELWKTCIGHLESMTETLARAVQRVECTSAGHIRLVFPAKSKLAMSRCESPVHRDAIARTLTDLAGRKVTLEFFAEAGPPEPVIVPKASGVTRMQRMRELENHELVKACVELFEAEIVKVDHPQIPPPA
jgi:DNA polymerase III subunit gamma/tau